MGQHAKHVAWMRARDRVHQSRTRYGKSAEPQPQNPAGFLARAKLEA